MDEFGALPEPTADFAAADDCCADATDQWATQDSGYGGPDAVTVVSATPDGLATSDTIDPSLAYSGDGSGGYGAPPMAVGAAHGDAAALDTGATSAFAQEYADLLDTSDAPAATEQAITLESGYGGLLDTSGTPVTGEDALEQQYAGILDDPGTALGEHTQAMTIDEYLANVSGGPATTAEEDKARVDEYLAGIANAAPSQPNSTGPAVGSASLAEMELEVKLIDSLHLDDERKAILEDSLHEGDPLWTIIKNRVALTKTLGDDNPGSFITDPNPGSFITDPDPGWSSITEPPAIPNPGDS